VKKIQPPKRKRGGQAKPPEERKHPISVWLTLPERAELKAAAGRTGIGPFIAELALERLRERQS
jgi:hypothetical protein